MLKKILGLLIIIILIVVAIFLVSSLRFFRSPANQPANSNNNQNFSENYNINDNRPEQNLNTNQQVVSDFCGWSTNTACQTNDDCQVDGCSGQVCRATTDDFIGTTCEWRDCYDEAQYNLICQCYNNQCQWH